MRCNQTSYTYDKHVEINWLQDIIGWEINEQVYIQDGILGNNSCYDNSFAYWNDKAAPYDVPQSCRVPIRETDKTNIFPLEPETTVTKALKIENKNI